MEDFKIYCIGTVLCRIFGAINYYKAFIILGFSFNNQNPSSFPTIKDMPICFEIILFLPYYLNKSR